MNRNFSQTIAVRCAEPERLIGLLAQWDRDQASTDVMGYMGTRVLADRDRPGEYLIIADFGVVDPDVSAAEEAARNNERAETKAMGVAVAEVIDGAPTYRNFDEVYRTDP